MSAPRYTTKGDETEVEVIIDPSGSMVPTWHDEGKGTLFAVRGRIDCSSGPLDPDTGAPTDPCEEVVILGAYVDEDGETREATPDELERLRDDDVRSHFAEVIIDRSLPAD